jgi:hypothetical protein
MESMKNAWIYHPKNPHMIFSEIREIERGEEERYNL